MPPRPPHHPPKGGERSKAAGAQAVRRQTTVTRALRSARGCNMNRLAGTRGEATYTAPDSAGCAVLQAASPQCRGSRGTPLVLLWGIQRGYSLREENTPFAWQWRSAPHYPCSANGAAPPRPPAREIKKDTLFEKRIPPFSGSSAKSCTNSCSASGAATTHPHEGRSKGIPSSEREETHVTSKCHNKAQM